MSSKESIVQLGKAVQTIFTELSLKFLEDSSESSFALTKEQKETINSLITAASAHSDDLVRARAEDLSVRLFTKLLAKIEAFNIEKHEEIPLYITRGRTFAKDIVAKVSPSQSNTPRSDKSPDDPQGDPSPRPRSSSVSGSSVASSGRRSSISIVTSPRKSPRRSFSNSASAIERQPSPDSADVPSVKVPQAMDEEVRELMDMVLVMEESSLTIKERPKFNLPECFAAPDFIDMMLKKKLAKTRDVAVRSAIRMQNHKLIVHVHGPHIFKDDPTSFFRFPNDDSTSTSSQLEMDWRKTAAVQKEIAELHKGAKKSLKDDELDHGTFKKKIHAIWTTFDVNGNGTLDDNEQELFFGLVYDQIYLSSAAKKKAKTDAPPPPRAETISKWKKHFDANGDGLIQWDEFKASISLLVDINEAERLRFAETKVSEPEPPKVKVDEGGRQKLLSSRCDSKLDASNLFVKDAVYLVQKYAGIPNLDDEKKNTLRQAIWAKFAVYHSAMIPKASDTPPTERRETLMPNPMLKDAKGKSQGSLVDIKKTSKDFESLEKVSKKSSSSEELDEKIKSLWQTFDVDGNGILDMQEQESFFGVVYDYIFKKKGSLKLRKESRDETISHWRKHFDANKDGQLSWNEFKESMKLIQDADEAEKILERALHAPDQVVDDSIASSQKFLYSDSMLSLTVKAYSRKGSQLGKIPKFDLIGELVKLLETTFPKEYEKMTGEQKRDFKKELNDRIDDYDESTAEALSADKKSQGKTGEEKVSSSKSKALTRKMTVSKKAPKAAKATEIGSTVTSNPTRHVADLLIIYLKTLNALIESIAPREANSQKESVKELRVDLYAVSTQIGNAMKNAEFLKTVPKSESLLAVHQNVMSILDAGFEGKQIEFNMERLVIGSHVLQSKKKFLDNAARTVSPLLGSSTATLSTLLSGASSDLDRFSLLTLTRGFLNLIKSINNDIESAIAISDLKIKSPKQTFNLAPSVWDANPEVADPDIDPNDSFRPGSFNQILDRLTSSPLTVGRIDSLLFGGLNFGPPEFIVSKFIERFNVPSDFKKQHPEQAEKIKESTAQLFGCFLRKELHSMDSNIFAQLEKFCHSIQKEESEVSSDIMDIIKSFSSRFLVKGFKVPFNFYSFLSFEDEEIAEQISRLDWAYYKTIEPGEFEDQSWNKAKNEVYGKNLAAFMNRVNAISHWTATAVILPEKLSMRQEVVKRLVGVAKCLRDLNNFSSLVGVLTGFNMAACQRLKFSFETHGKVTSTLKSLNAFQDPSKSFGYLRDAIAEVEDDECIPFIGVFLGDLVLMDDGNPDRVTLKNVELINLPKYRMMSQTVSSVLQYKYVDVEQSRYEVYDPEPIEPLTSYFSRPPFLMEEELYKISLEREPRGVTAKDLV